MTSAVTPSSYKRVFVGADAAYATQVPDDDLFHVAGPYGPIFRVVSTATQDALAIPRRMFLGAAEHHDGSLGGGAAADWFSAGVGVSAGMAWVHYAAMVALTVPDGTVGFAAASRASDVPIGYGSTQTSIPFVGIAIMDRAGTGPPYWTSYGAYLEARIETASALIGTTIGMEIDAINFGGAVPNSTPWRRQDTGGATALWLASGGDPANHGRALSPAQLALGIVNNGETFMSGIVIANDAIEGTDGSSGFGQAIGLSTRHLLSWYAAAGGAHGSMVNYITSTNTVPGHSLQFQDGGSFFASAAGTIDFNVANIASSVNGLGVIPAVSGQSPVLHSLGPAADIDLSVKPQGDGHVRAYCEQLLFYSDDGYQMAGILHQVTDPDLFNTLQFADGGPFFYGRGGIILGLVQEASPVGHLTISNAAAGDPVGLVVQGTGDIDIKIAPKGNGHVGVWADQLLFYSDFGFQMSGIVSSVTDETLLPTLEFTDTGAFIRHDGGVVVDFQGAASAVSHLSIFNGASSLIGMSAVGSGDIDILLDPGGSAGTLRLAVPVASSASVGGASALPGVPSTYFIVKDGAGTSFKIPAWNP